MKILKLLVVCLSLAGSAFAQTAVTAADLNKLDADALRVSQQITALKRVDPTRAQALCEAIRTPAVRTRCLEFVGR